MEFTTFVFYVLATIMLGAALGTITARNPVHAALFLVLAFFTAAGLWMLLQAEFLAIVLIMVYVGAVMVLFLFVVMMLDIDIVRLRHRFWSYLPLGAVIGLLMVAEMALVLSGKYFSAEALPGQSMPAGYSNTKELGRLLFTEYVYPFELASVILLVGIIAAVMLTLRQRKDSKYQKPSEQLAVKRNDRVRLVQMDAVKDEPAAPAEQGGQ
jgi:NADH-quinone oxidoreductase subunit J